MNTVESIKKEINEDAKYAYLYKLRGNNILNWIEELKEVNQYKLILNNCTTTSTLTVKSGIVLINPMGYYISHKFAPHVESGFSFFELSTVMKYEIIRFEDKYGEVLISDKDIEGLAKILYMYNRIRHDLDMSDRKKLIHLENTAEVLYYTLSTGVTLKSEINGWCSLTFYKDNNVRKDYCTVFNEEQLSLLERVNISIKNNRK